MSALDPRLSRWLVWLAPGAVLALAIGWQTDWGREFRRAPPAETPVAPAPVATTVLPEFRIEGGVASMTGTVVTDKAAIAFLRETGGAGKARSVRKGESINGMTVAEVAPDRVRFTMGDDSEELELKVAKGPKTTVQPAAEGASQAPQQGAAPQAAPIGQGDAAGVRRAAQGGLAGPGDAGDNLRANRRAARAAEAQQGGGQQGVTPAQTQQNRQQRRQQQAR